ncbi:MAG: FtsQ-type POTRA domain-containing protein [Sporomusaceae bacterium]|jgi:cell division protein FtsQ|nr:FtsQ-type POTRA domain-containing protein [Sporomusaceae bacterium]
MRAKERIKSERKRRRTVLAVWLGALAILTAFFLFITSSYFILGSVEVLENKYISTEDVLSIANVPAQINVFRLNTGEIKERLLHDLRIAEAKVERKFPTTILISVQERKPVGFTATPYGYAEFDKKGVILAVYKNLKQNKIPIITGTKLGNVFVGDEIPPGVLKGAVTYLAYLDEATINLLSEINVKDGFAAYTSNSVYIRLGAQERLEDKAKLTVDILREISGKNLKIEYIDLTYTAPVLKLKE